ncbi:MAG: hypothetical protein V3V95_04030 [Thermodesulfobacteriota bacterium]
MKLKKKYILWAIIIICLLTIFGVARHSVDEIHYMKRFYPPEFTVEEAYYASKVEFIKVVITSIPFVLLTFVALFMLKYRKK